MPEFQGRVAFLPAAGFQRRAARHARGLCAIGGTVCARIRGGGGSYAYADPARGVAFALTKTRLVPNFDTALSVTTILADHLAGTC